LKTEQGPVKKGKKCVVDPPKTQYSPEWSSELRVARGSCGAKAHCRRATLQDSHQEEVKKMIMIVKNPGFSKVSLAAAQEGAEGRGGGRGGGERRRVHARSIL